MGKVLIIAGLYLPHLLLGGKCIGNSPSHKAKGSSDKWISKDELISCFLKAFIWPEAEIRLR